MYLRLKLYILFIIFTEKNPIPFEKHISSCLAEIKYEIKSHTYKIDCLNEKIDFIEEHIKSFKSYNKCIIGTTCNEILTGDDIMLDSLICLWPLKNDDDLYEFENILQDKTKKRQCVSNYVIHIYGKKNNWFIVFYLFINIYYIGNYII